MVKELFFQNVLLMDATTDKTAITLSFMMATCLNAQKAETFCLEKMSFGPCSGGW